MLCRAQGPRNAGLAARAVANFGPAELVLAAPADRSVLADPQYLEGAHGVARTATSVRVCGSLDEALADATAAVGFTARVRGHRETRDFWQALPELKERAGDPQETVALVFGNETAGLDARETAHLSALLWIPTAAEHGSINLAACVSIVLAAMYGSARAPRRTKKGRPVSGAERAYLVQHLQESLGALVTSAAARRDLEHAIERLFGRAALETRDARAFHRLGRALGNRSRPVDYGLPPPRRHVKRRKSS